MNAISTCSRTSCLAASLGQVDYIPAWDLQKSLHQRVVEGLLPNLLLLLEHPHVYTLGRRGKASDILVSDEKLAGLGAEIHHIDRGGEATYHGPGQLVGYPIISLRAWKGGPLKYVRALEETLIATLAEFGIRGESTDRPTGVWVGRNKIAAIGVKVSRGATMHGFALNVNPDLSYFDHVVPCGMPDSQVTSMSDLLSQIVQIEQVVPILVRHFGQVFGWEMEQATLEEFAKSMSVGRRDLFSGKAAHRTGAHEEYLRSP